MMYPDPLVASERLLLQDLTAGSPAALSHELQVVPMVQVRMNQTRVARVHLNCMGVCFCRLAMSW